MGFVDLSKVFSTYIGIDLGTANTLVYVKDQGIVLAEPSVVAVKTKVEPQKIIAVGGEAKDMLGKTPGNIQAIRPMKDGVIANFEITEAMLRYFIKKALRTVPWHRQLLSPKVLIAVPTGITEVEHRAVEDSAKRSGAGEVVLVDEPMAAAIGSDLDVDSSTGCMITDIGGGTSDIAIIALGGVVTSTSLRMA
ncbi:MAG: rod shape-determining protein, partial [Lentisphaeria bacterium]|nr:rod shape-determining protein [Lentisphaeria bacterium]